MEIITSIKPWCTFMRPHEQQNCAAQWKQRLHYVSTPPQYLHTCLSEANTCIRHKMLNVHRTESVLCDGAQCKTTWNTNEASKLESPYPRVIRFKTYRDYVKPWIILTAIYVYIYIYINPIAVFVFKLQLYKYYIYIYKPNCSLYIHI
jgi:hypothetical protein